MEDGLAFITSELAAAHPHFKLLAIKPAQAFRGTAASAVRFGLVANRLLKTLTEEEDLEEALSEFAADQIKRSVVRTAFKPVRNAYRDAHLHTQRAPKKDFWRKNGLGGRSWYNKPSRQEMVIVYHDANRAGPHIDVHIGRLSVVYRVKPDLYAQLRYNRDGMLTDASRQAIVNHVRSEILNGSRVPQNLDHTVRGRTSSWTGGSKEDTHYGAGPTRQVVLRAQVDIYKAFDDGPIEMYAPSLWPHRDLYMYRLYPGDEKRAPIVIWGAKSAHPPPLVGKLHLKLVDPAIIIADKLHTKADPSTSTAKYDGSSAYIVITPKGTTLWSPRISKVTGEQIEYTGTLNQLAMVTSPVTIVGMGEVMFRVKGKYPWSRSDYLPQAAGSGILNSNELLPDNVIPEIRLYRIDRVGRDSLVDQPFWENRAVQEEVAKLAPDILKVVELMDPAAALLRGFEGIVAVPEGLSVHEGIKIKYWQDPHDWRIDKIDLYPGPKGGVAGVVWYTSLESGRKFKLGPSNVGDRTLQLAMMENPDAYEGAVVKVRSRHGHEGRASQVVGVHDDKGFGI